VIDEEELVRRRIRGGSRPRAGARTARWL